MNETFTCSHCGEEHPVADRMVFNGQELCRSCYETETCVNLTPRYTIEFRMFRGTLKYNTLIATLQMVGRLCDVAFSLSDKEAKVLTWSTFVADIQEDAMPELIQYLKERRLYVNEPVEAGEEV